MDREKFSLIKSDLLKVYEQFPILAILLFGSQTSGNTHKKSDIDICVVLKPQGDIWENAYVEEKYIKDIIMKIWSIIGDRYDIWLFQELPFHLKASVIDNHEVIHCDDIPLLYEYFYRYHSKIGNYKRRMRIAFGRE